MRLEAYLLFRGRRALHVGEHLGVVLHDEGQVRMLLREREADGALAPAHVDDGGARRQRSPEIVGGEVSRLVAGLRDESVEEAGGAAGHHWIAADVVVLNKVRVLGEIPAL